MALCDVKFKKKNSDKKQEIDDEDEFSLNWDICIDAHFINDVVILIDFLRDFFNSKHPSIFTEITYGKFPIEHLRDFLRWFATKLKIPLSYVIFHI